MMARRKTPREEQKEREQELIAKYGVKKTNPIVTVLMGKNEEKMKELTGDKNFGSTVKDAFVEGVTAQANNQTILAENTGNYIKSVAGNYGQANAAYGDAYARQAENVGKTANQTVKHWAKTNAANSTAHLQMGKQLNDHKIR